LYRGAISVSEGDARLKIFVDSGAAVIHLVGESAQPSTVSVTLESWRNSLRTLPADEQDSAWSAIGAPFPLQESADHLNAEPDSPRFTWYHRNESSVVPALLANQSLTGAPGAFDPLLHRTFGGSISGPDFSRTAQGVAMTKAANRFDFQIATASFICDDPKQWISAVHQESDRSKLAQAEKRTQSWWNSFWNRSWIFASGPGADDVNRSYALQRLVQACQGRGTYPIKFNGGSYTVEPTAMGKPFNADWRAWGDAYWFQNTRHMYHPMPACGDLEMMDPFFSLYEKARPLAESRTRLYHHAEGAYFPETMTSFGTYAGRDYGWNRTGLDPSNVESPWWRFAWNQSLELVALMLDRWDYDRDDRFLKDHVLPMANSSLRYFDTRFKRDADGRIVLDPDQSIETYWEGVINDMPSTAGLIAVTERLCALPPRLVPADERKFFERMKAASPELPLQAATDGEELSPAQRYKPSRSNVENPELYAVWPFRLVDLNHPKLLTEARRAYRDRHEHLDVGWGYDGNVAALLGMTDEAVRILKVKCANSNPHYRWPATWGPNFDWLPDQNHGGNLLNTVNLMLLQADPLEQGGSIRILPAWPKEWDVHFKLHAPGNTTVECQTQAGKIVKLVVTPSSRATDVVLPPF
jgi:hypothetical protein